jgi:hypothetical protein
VAKVAIIYHQAYGTSDADYNFKEVYPLEYREYGLRRIIGYSTIFT